MKIKLNPIRPQLIITIVFLLIIFLEALSLYAQVYQKLSPEASTVQNESVVRLNLTSYNKTIELLDELKNFVVAPWNIQNPNLF